MELLDDRLWRALGKKEAEPGRGLEIEPLLLRAGELRQHRRAIAREDRNGLDQFAFDLLLGGRAQRAEVVDAAGDQILHRRASPAVWNVGDVDPDRRVEQHAVEMAGGPSSR